MAREKAEDVVQERREEIQERTRGVIPANILTRFYRERDATLERRRYCRKYMDCAVPNELVLFV